jgi:hypothetical protein
MSEYEDEDYGVMVHRPHKARAHRLDKSNTTYVLDIGNVTFFISDVVRAREINLAARELVSLMEKDMADGRQ